MSTIRIYGGAVFGVFLKFGKMKRMLHDSDAPRRRLEACVCFGGLDAAVGAGLGIGFAGCGDGLLRWSDVPLARAWAEEKFEAIPAPPKDAPMANCERHARRAAMDCSLACCHQKDPAVAGAIVFVLPLVVEISAPLLIGRPTPGRPSSIELPSF